VPGVLTKLLAARRLPYAVFGALVLGAAGAWAQASGWGIAARVNDATISMSRLDRTFDGYMSNQGIDQGVFRDPGRYKRLKQQVLEMLITHELLYQDAQSKGLVPDDEALAQALEQVKKGYPSEADFRLELRQQSITEAEYAEDLRRRLAVKRLIDEDIAPRLQVTDEEVHAFYTENEPQFHTPEEARGRHILIRLPAGAGEKEQQAARARIDAIHAELRAGADFAELAERTSEDAGSAARGGDLGFVARGRLTPAFERVLFGLEPGQLSEVVRTEFGYHVIRLEARRGGERVTESEAAGRIREFLQKERIEEAVVARIEALREAANLEVHVPL
jgi:parvulin-like peptidyl-prolyl isomerase